MSFTPTIVPATRTGQSSRSRADQDAWIRSRHAALYAEMKRRGVPNAWNVASAIMAHWGDETGWGRSEWNFNIANARSVGQCPNAILLQGSDDAVPRPYCAYGSLEEGVARTVDILLKPRYTEAWNYLLSTVDGVGYFDRLMRAGWHPWSQASLDSYRSEYARVQRTVGAPVAESSPSLWVAVTIALAAVGVAVWIVADDRP